jgi:hypothetical protein
VGHTVYYQLQRGAPLDAKERSALVKHAAKWRERKWSSETYDLTISGVARGRGGILARGMTKVAEGDLDVLLDALVELAGIVPSSELHVDDDFGSVREDPRAKAAFAGHDVDLDLDLDLEDEDEDEDEVEIEGAQSEPRPGAHDHDAWVRRTSGVATAARVEGEDILGALGAVELSSNTSEFGTNVLVSLAKIPPGLVCDRAAVIDEHGKCLEMDRAEIDVKKSRIVATREAWILDQLVRAELELRVGEHKVTLSLDFPPPKPKTRWV